MTTIKDLAALAEMTSDTLLSRIKGEYGDLYPEIYQWDEDTPPTEEQTDLIVEWLGLDELVKKPNIEAAAIITTQQAIQEIKGKFAATLQVQNSRIEQIHTDKVQYEGAFGGTNDAIRFKQSYDVAFSKTIDQIASAIEEQTEANVVRLEAELMKLSKMNQELLGQAVRAKAASSERMGKLAARVAALLD